MPAFAEGRERKLSAPVAVDAQASLDGFSSDL
jgi:hypothetical protein